MADDRDKWKEITVGAVQQYTSLSPLRGTTRRTDHRKTRCVRYIRTHEMLTCKIRTHDMLTCGRAIFTKCLSRREHACIQTRTYFHQLGRAGTPDFRHRSCRHGLCIILCRFFNIQNGIKSHITVTPFNYGLHYF